MIGGFGTFARLGAVSGRPRAPVAPNPTPDVPTVTLSSLISLHQGLLIPERKEVEGILVRGISAVWLEIARTLGSDFSRAMELTPHQWEEMVAGAFERDGYRVILTPPSGDLGRDVIATRDGVGSVKILGSVKAYKPGHLVKHDDVRALLGVISAERDVSKGILATTSDFAPRIADDALIKPHLPTRLELMNGIRLQQWLRELTN